MLRLITLFAGFTLVCAVSTVTLIQSLSRQPEWNVIIFDELRLLRNRNTSPRYTGEYMMDLNTHLMRRLPFTYSDESEVEYSDDGRRTLITRDTGPWHSDLFLVDPEAAIQSRRLTDGIGYNVMPDATNDLTRVVFVSNRDGLMGIFTMILDEEGIPHDIRRVTHPGIVNPFEPQWLTREQYFATLPRTHMIISD